MRRRHEIKPAPRIHPVKNIEATVFRKQALMDDLNIRLDFEVYEETGDMVVRIFNRETEELVREIPPEELLKIHKNIADLHGILFDEKA